MDIINSMLEGIDEDFKDFPPLRFLASTVKVKPSFIVIPLIFVVLLISLLFPSIAPSVITMFTIIYPSYMTFEAIHNGNREKCKKWMVFWIIYAGLIVFNGVIKTLLFFLPAFYAFKFLFILWLFYPRTDGTTIIYEKIFKPYAAQIRAAAKKLATGN